MSRGDLAQAVEAAWEERDTLTPESGGVAAAAVETALALLDSGEARVAEKRDGAWVVNQWLKKAVLLSFRLNDMAAIPGGRARMRPGTTRCRRSSRAGTKRASGTQASAPCPVPSCGARPTSRPVSC